MSPDDSVAGDDTPPLSLEPNLDEEVDDDDVLSQLERCAAEAQKATTSTRSGSSKRKRSRQEASSQALDTEYLQTIDLSMKANTKLIQKLVEVNDLTPEKPKSAREPFIRYVEDTLKSLTEEDFKTMRTRLTPSKTVKEPNTQEIFFNDFDRDLGFDHVKEWPTLTQYTANRRKHRKHLPDVISISSDSADTTIGQLDNNSIVSDATEDLNTIVIAPQEDTSYGDDDSPSQSLLRRRRSFSSGRAKTIVIVPDSDNGSPSQSLLRRRRSLNFSSVSVTTTATTTSTPTASTPTPTAASRESSEAVSILGKTIYILGTTNQVLDSSLKDEPGDAEIQVLKDVAEKMDNTEK